MCVSCHPRARLKQQLTAGLAIFECHSAFLSCVKYFRYFTSRNWPTKRLRPRPSALIYKRQFYKRFGWKTMIQSRPNIMSWSEDHMVSRLTYPTCRIGYEWNMRRWTSYTGKQQKRMIFLTSKSLALDRHAKQYEALFLGGTVNSSWCRMPQHSKLNFAIKHKAWHYIDNIQNKLLTQEYLSRVTIYF